MDDQIFQPDIGQILDEILVAFLLLRHGCLGCLLYRQNRPAGSGLRIDLARGRITCTCQISGHIDEVFLQFHHIRAHLRRRNGANDFMYIVHRLSVDPHRAAHGVQRPRVGDHASDRHLLGIRLLFHRQHPAHLRLVDLDLVGDQVSHLALTSGTALFFLPHKVGDGIQGKSRVHILPEGDPPGGNGEAHRTLFLVQLVHHRHHVVQLQLGRLAAFFKGVIIADDEIILVLTAQLMGQLRGIHHRHPLADQDIGLRLDVVVILIAVVDIAFLDDLIDGHHLLPVKVHIDDALIVDGRVLGDPAALEVHLVLFPHPGGVTV